MTYNETLDFIHGIPRFSKKLGLEKISVLLDKLGNPQNKLKFVHIAGTNGKGSTCTMLSYVLNNAGYKAGLYISPFVISFCERIQVNNEMIPQEELASVVGQVKAVWESMAKDGEPPSEFEVVFASALLYFVKSKCDVVVVEVGIGGKFDSTNIIPPPLVAAITSIGIDHAAILGDTVEQIAGEKAGIIKKGSAVVCYPKQPVEALEVIMEKCAEENVPLVIPHNAEVLRSDFSGSEIIYKEEKYFVKLLGEHQIYNSLVVIEVANLLKKQGLGITYDNIAFGLANVTFPARVEILSKEPLVVLDGAHNIDGAKTLSKAIKMIENKTLIGIIGMVKSKQVTEVIEELAPNFKKIITTLGPDNKDMFFDARELADISSKSCCDVSYSYDPIDALKTVLAGIKRDEAVVIGGSLYLASYVRNHFSDIMTSLEGNLNE